MLQGKDIPPICVSMCSFMWPICLVTLGHLLQLYVPSLSFTISVRILLFSSLILLKFSETIGVTGLFFDDNDKYPILFLILFSTLLFSSCSYSPKFESSSWWNLSVDSFSLWNEDELISDTSTSFSCSGSYSSKCVGSFSWNLSLDSFSLEDKYCEFLQFESFSNFQKLFKFLLNHFYFSIVNVVENIFNILWINPTKA